MFSWVRDRIIAGLKICGTICLCCVLGSILPKQEKTGKVRKEGENPSFKRPVAQTGPQANPRPRPGAAPRKHAPNLLSAAAQLITPSWLIPGAGPFVLDQSGLGKTKPGYKLRLVRCSAVLSPTADGQWQLTNVQNEWKLERARGISLQDSISGSNLVPPCLTETTFPSASLQSLLAAGDSQTQSNPEAARLLQERTTLAAAEMSRGIAESAVVSNMAVRRGNDDIDSAKQLFARIKVSTPTHHTFSVRDGQIHWVAETPGL